MAKKNLIHDAFVAGIAIKGVDAVLQIIGGAALLAIPPKFLNKLMMSIATHELSKEPGDFIASHLAQWAEQWSAGFHFFAALYLLSHGIAKLAVVIVLLKGKLWAYHVGIIFFLLFIVYQLYRYSYTHSPWLIVLTVFDIIVIWLTWAEYKRVKQSGAVGPKK